MNFRNILIFRIGHLGDTVVGLPALWRVRHAMPDARLTLLSNADSQNPDYVSARGVLPENGLVDDWISYPSNAGSFSSIISFTRLAWMLRLRSFDAVVYLMPRTRTAAQIRRDRFFFRIAVSGPIIGIENLERNRIPEHAPHPMVPVERESDYLWNCLDHDRFPGSDLKRSTDLALTPAEFATADAWLMRHAKNPLLIAISPGSKWPSKVWKEENFASIVSRLIERYGVFPIIFGGPEDAEIGDRLVGRWGAGANSAGKFTVRQSAAALSRCGLYLGNDTGTMHLAAAVGVKCVGIFAAIDWIGRWEPFGASNRILRKSVGCEGCHTPNCFNAHKCLELITVDEVFRSSAEILDMSP